MFHGLFQKAPRRPDMTQAGVGAQQRCWTGSRGLRTGAASALTMRPIEKLASAMFFG
jgi:hypothetical protein